MHKTTLMVDILVHDEDRLIDAARSTKGVQHLDLVEIGEMIPEKDVGTALRVVIRDRAPLPGCDILTIKAIEPSVLH